MSYTLDAAPKPSRRSQLVDLACLIAAALFSSIWCLTASARLGATFDEPVYLQAGLNGWRTGSHHGLLRLGTMPLPGDVQTLPLYLFERFSGQSWNFDSDFATMLQIARGTNLLFWWLLLFAGWRLGRSVAGAWGARLAVAILAVEPNLLAHASLATTDIALTACLFVFLDRYVAGRGRSIGPRIIIPGICYGIALAAKASALVFVPLCMLAIELASRPDWRTRWRSFLADSVKIGLTGIATVVVLCGSDWQPQASFVAWAEQLPESFWRSSMVWFAKNLCIFSNAFEGISRQIKHNMRGHGTYLLGKAHDHAFWYYFPVLLTMKLTIPFLAGWLAVLAFKPRAALSWISATVLALLVFSLNCRVQIGIRLVLPLVALAAVALGVAGSKALSSAAFPTRRRWLGLASMLGVGWMTWNAVAIWPDGLRTINEAWLNRGPGYVLASDSNFDWGQGLPELAQWQQSANDATLHVWYFGTDPKLKQLPMTELPLHILPGDPAEKLRGKLVAASTTLVYGYGLTADSRRAAEYLRGQKPIAETSTFLIFDFREIDSKLARSGRETK